MNQYPLLRVQSSLINPLRRVARINDSRFNSVANEFIEESLKRWFNEHQDVPCEWYLLSKKRLDDMIARDRGERAFGFWFKTFNEMLDNWAADEEYQAQIAEWDRLRAEIKLF